jgi:hypothetical protein
MAHEKHFHLHAKPPTGRRLGRPMKKAANCMSLAAFVMRYGGLGSIERCLATRMNARFLDFLFNLYPRLYPRFNDAWHFPESVDK